MNISMRAFRDLSHEEIYFVYCVLRKYKMIPEPQSNGNGKKKRNSRQRTINNDRQDGIPNLNNIKCKSWDDCTDEYLLMYKAIMEKTTIND